MNPYSATPRALVRDVTTDLLALALVVVAVRTSRSLEASVAAQAAPLTATGREVDSVTDRISTAAGDVSDLPLVGDSLSAPLGDAAGALGGLSGRIDQAGADVVELSQHVGTVSLVLLLVVVLVPWLALRVHSVRARMRTERLLALDPRLLALEELLEHPGHAVGPDTLDQVLAGGPEAHRLAQRAARRRGARMREAPRSPGR